MNIQESINRISQLAKEILRNKSRQLTATFLGLIIIFASAAFIGSWSNSISGAPPYGESESEVPNVSVFDMLFRNITR